MVWQSRVGHLSPFPIGNLDPVDDRGSAGEGASSAILFLRMVQWCIRLTRLTLVCEVIRYRLVQVRQNLKKDFSGWQPAIAFLSYLFLFHSLLRLTSFLSQYKAELPFGAYAHTPFPFDLSLALKTHSSHLCPIKMSSTLSFV